MFMVASLEPVPMFMVASLGLSLCSWWLRWVCPCVHGGSTGSVPMFMGLRWGLSL